jgi:flagellar motor switch protein FliN/FliY
MSDASPPAGSQPAARANAAAMPSTGDRKTDAYQFERLQSDAAQGEAANLDFLLDIPLTISVELGRTRLMINELLKLSQGSVIELGKPSGATLDILANQRLIARGEAVKINDKYGVRLTEVISPMERVKRLK